MSSILFWALVGIVCLSPLPLASNRPLPWSLLALGVGLLLLAWGASRLYEAMVPAGVRDTAGAGNGADDRAHGRRIDRRAALLTIGFAVLMAWYWVQASPRLSGGHGHPAWAEASAALGESVAASASLDPAAGHTLVMKILAYGGIFLLAFVLGRDRVRARLAFWAVCVSGFAYALYGLFVHFAHSGTVLWFTKDAYPDSVTSTFINRNAYATYAGMTLLAGLALLLSELRRFRPERLTPLRIFATLSDQGSPSIYLVIAATITGLVAVVLTGSRAGLACVVLALFVFAVGMLIARDMRLRTFLIGAVLGAGAIAGILSLSGGFLAKRLISETAPEARAAVFEVARLAAMAHPWTGQGLGGFGPAFNRANDGRAVFETYIDLAHNSYLELAVEGGVPALVLSLMLLAGGVGICFAGLLRGGRTTSTSIAAVAIATLVGTHAMVDFGIQMPAVAATFMLLIGVAAAQALAVERGGVQRVAADERRRRFGSARRHGTDEATPPSEIEVPLPVRPAVPGLTGRMRAATSLPALTGPSAPVLEGEATAATASAGEASKTADDYTAALARWRTLRQGATGNAAGDAAPDPTAGARPPTRPADAPALTPSGAPGEPEPRPATIPIEPLHIVARSAPAHPSRAPHPRVIPFAPPAPTTERPPREGLLDTADEPAQPPTPSAWPGAVAPASPSDGAKAPADDEGSRRAANVVDLPRPSRS
jgi:O-antigen ligase